jgi:hypothetical protein
VCAVLQPAWGKIHLRVIDADLKFLLPIICDDSLPKVVVFVPKRLVSMTGGSYNVINFSFHNNILCSCLVP